MWCDCGLFGQLKCLFRSFSVGLARQANRLTDWHYQSHESTASHWSLSSWSFCCLWHYWPFHFSASPQILVWIHWNCLILDSLLPFISVLLCWYQWHQISSLSTSLWCTSRFCSWPSSLHSLYNSTQHNNLSIICQPQTLCWWHATFLIIFSRGFLRKNSTFTRYNFWNFIMDGF